LEERFHALVSSSPRARRAVEPALEAGGAALKARRSSADAEEEADEFCQVA